MAFLALSVLPLVVAEEATAPVDGGVIVGPEDVECSDPEMYTDATQRSWFPNDQTIYTADIYGEPDTSLYGDAFYEVPQRGDYAFTGETVIYHVLVEDKNGADDIDSVLIQMDGTGIGSCLEIAVPTDAAVSSATDGRYTTWPAYAVAKYGISAWDADTMSLYGCTAIIQSGWSGASEFNIAATDGAETSDDCIPVTVTSVWSDSLILNPALALSVANSIDFGSVTPGSTATSNTIYLTNVGTEGVVMDMYIASDDYFTDPANPAAICGTGNGIRYDRFKYYATKGSLDSGNNNNLYPGLGEDDGICAAQADEFTLLPSHSGEIGDMCRIINYLEDGSLLSQGQSMSLTFRLMVPSPCEGEFTDGQFHFVGRVV